MVGDSRDRDRPATVSQHGGARVRVCLSSPSVSLAHNSDSFTLCFVFDRDCCIVDNEAPRQSLPLDVGFHAIFQLSMSKTLKQARHRFG